jgi:biotin carboxylase
MSNGSTVVVIGAGPFQVPAITEAKRLGYVVVAIDGDANAVGFKDADQHFVVNVKDAEACLEVIRPLKPVAVLALAAEVAVVTVAKVCAALGLPGISPEAALNSTNKKRMRECFLKAGLPSPQFIPLQDTIDLSLKATSVGYPLVLKPADSAGSRGVSIVEKEEQLQDAYTHAHHYSTSGEVLMEEYMPGIEISVEACVQNGEVTILALSDKIRTPWPYPLDTRVIFPSNKPADIQDRAKEIAVKAIRACGINNAVIHMEMMVTPEGPKLVELAARGAGFHVFSKMLGWVCGINTVEMLINISLGKKVQLDHLQQRGAVLSFPPAKSGIVKSIEGVDAVRTFEGIQDAALYISPGDQVNVLKSGSDRIGHVISYGKDREDALRIADTAERMLKIEII